MFHNFYKNKTVLVTGHTGFKGAWLVLWLKKMGANVVGYSKNVPTIPSHFKELNFDNRLESIEGNICDREYFFKKFSEYKFDVVFHLAAQSLVRRSYRNPLETWDTNLGGTLNILEVLKNLRHKCAAVIITSDKCYDNVEWPWGYRESDTLGGDDPYSGSKGAAELLFKSYFKSFFAKDEFICAATARAGNVIGGGDWAEDRIVPDIFKSWVNKSVLQIRSPNSTRPWQHVLEPLGGYLLLGSSLYHNKLLNGESFNFGPAITNAYTVKDLVIKIEDFFSGLGYECGELDENSLHEFNLLKLNCDKAMAYLKWQSLLSFDETVQMTGQWYRNYQTKDISVTKYSEMQIDDYCNLAKIKGNLWAS